MTFGYSLTGCALALTGESPLPAWPRTSGFRRIGLSASWSPESDPSTSTLCRPRDGISGSESRSGHPFRAGIRGRRGPSASRRSRVSGRRTHAATSQRSSWQTSTTWTPRTCGRRLAVPSGQAYARPSPTRERARRKQNHHVITTPGAVWTRIQGDRV